MNKVVENQVFNTIKNLINTLNEKLDENPDESLNEKQDKYKKRVDMFKNLFSYLLTKNAKLLIATFKNFRTSIQNKINEISINNNVKNDIEFILIINELNKFILQVNNEEEFLELKLNI